MAPDTTTLWLALQDEEEWEEDEDLDEDEEWEEDEDLDEDEEWEEE
jgi:hypothetical protein